MDRPNDPNDFECVTWRSYRNFGLFVLALLAVPVGGRLLWSVNYDRQNAAMRRVADEVRQEVEAYRQEHGSYPTGVPGGSYPGVPRDGFRVIYGRRSDGGSYFIDVSRGVFLHHKAHWWFDSATGDWAFSCWNQWF